MSNSTTHWFDRGSSGGSGPNTFDDDKNPGASDQWQRGREYAEQQQKLWDLWLKPDDPKKD